MKKLRHTVTWTELAIWFEEEFIPAYKKMVLRDIELNELMEGLVDRGLISVL